MELITKQVRMMHTKCQAVSQITFDEDLNVPDAKPDVGRMIQKKGEIQIEDLQISEGHAFISGALLVALLYVSDSEERKVQSLLGTLPIGETLHLEGLENGDKVRLCWDIEDLSVQLINSRKLNIKALVTFTGFVEEIKEVLLPAGVEEENISQKKKDISVMGIGVHKKDTMRVKEEITLASNKPNIHELLWNTVETRGMDIRTQNDKITVKGELFLFALYRGEDDNNSLQWLENSIPFYQEMECAGCREDMVPNVEIMAPHSELKVKTDNDGEERIISIDTVLEMEIKLYEEEELSILLGVYTPSRDLRTVCENTKLQSLLVKNVSKCRISDRMKTEPNQGKILQICHSDGNIKVDDTRLVENGIEVEGIVQVRILYIIGDDEMPFYSMDAMIPFSHVIEASQIGKDCVYHLRTDLEQLSTTMIDSDEIEVKIVMNLNALVFRQTDTPIVREIEEQELDREKLRSMPGIVAYQVQPQDTMWDIAKKFYTTTDNIVALNHLESEELHPYETLILMKTVES